MDLHDLGARLMMLNTLRRGVVSAATADCPLYGGQFPVLESIIRMPDSTQATLAEQLHVTPASIALSTKRLEKSGLIERRVDPKNRRKNMLRATEAGVRAAEVCLRGFDEADARTFSGFSEEELAVFCGLLERMIRNLAPEGEANLYPFCKEDSKK